MGANQMQPGTRNQCGQALHEFQRRHDDMGGAVAPGALELEHDLACAIALEPLVGNGRAGDIAAQAFELLALMGVTAYCRMQAEAVRVDAARLLGVGRPAGDGLQTQHFLPCVWAQGNAVGAGGRLQGRERAIGLGFGQVAQAPLFDEVAGARQQLQDALDDPARQRLELCHAGSARFMEGRFAGAAAIHPIEHQAMQMDVEIGR